MDKKGRKRRTTHENDVHKLQTGWNPSSGLYYERQKGITLAAQVTDGVCPFFPGNIPITW